MLFPFIRVPIARRWNNSSEPSPLFSSIGHSKLWVSWASSTLRFAYWPHKICRSCWSCLGIAYLKHLEGIMTGFRVVESVPSKINHRRWLHLLAIQCVTCCSSSEAAWFCASSLSELTILIFKALAWGCKPCGWSLGHSGLSKPSLLLVLELCSFIFLAGSDCGDPIVWFLINFIYLLVAILFMWVSLIVIPTRWSLYWGVRLLLFTSSIKVVEK